MMKPLTLYGDSHWDSPWVFSAFVAISEKNLPLTLRAIALDKREQHADDYSKRTLTARVPALDHDGFVLSESSAIVEYVEEAFPPPEHARVLPENRQDRARARQIMGWLRSDLMPIREERPTSSMFYERAGKPLSDSARASLVKLIRVSEELVRGDAYLFGNAFSIADAELSFMLHRLILNGDELPDRLTSWAKLVWERPSVQKFVNLERST